MEKIPPRYVLERIFKNARKHTFLNKRMVFVYINPFYIPSHTSSRTKHTFRIPPRDDTHSARTTHTHTLATRAVRKYVRICKSRVRARLSIHHRISVRTGRPACDRYVGAERAICPNTNSFFIYTHTQHSSYSSRAPVVFGCVCQMEKFSHQRTRVCTSII